jgi:glucan phosphoethanolaminetransferase (alkaline phosphatase superfamily)
MWQRIQTVFLVLVVLCMVFGLFMPIWELTTELKQMQLYPLHFSIKEGGVTTTSYFPYSITATLMVAAATLGIMSIRRFDNRMLQMKLGMLNSLLLAGVMICVVVFNNNVATQYGNSKYGYILFVVFGAVTFNWLAMRFIRRDEKMVRDSERLR